MATGGGMVAGGRLGWAVALAGAVALVPAMAEATGSIGCEALDGAAARAALTLGAGPVPPVLFVRIEADGRRWTTAAGEEGERIAVAQAFVTDEWFAVEVVDEQATRRVASVRVVRAEEGRRVHQYGYLHLHGVAVHPVACEGP